MMGDGGYLNMRTYAIRTCTCISTGFDHVYIKMDQLFEPISPRRNDYTYLFYSDTTRGIIYFAVLCLIIFNPTRNKILDFQETVP